MGVFIKENINFKHLIFLNCYQIFNNISYINGVNFLNSWFEDFKEYSIQMEKQIKFYLPNSHAIHINNIKIAETLLYQLRTNEFNTYYLPNNYENDSKNWYVESKNNTILTSNLFEGLFNKNKLKSQIAELDIILNAIKSEYYL